MIKGIGPAPGNRIEPLRTHGAEQGRDLAAPQVSTKSPIASQSAVSTAASQIAADGPPVDLDRVAQLRAAIADGSYTVDARAIADKMITLDLGIGEAQ